MASTIEKPAAEASMDFAYCDAVSALFWQVSFGERISPMSIPEIRYPKESARMVEKLSAFGLIMGEYAPNRARICGR